MQIFDNNGLLLLDVAVDDESYRYRAVCGENELTLRYSLAEHVELPVGSYCDFQGQRYTLERPESFKMKHSRNFDYTVTMESYQAKAKIWKFRNPVDGRLKFPLTAKPVEHLQMFVDNMNRRDSGWTVGECVDDVEHLINYDHDFCWDALAKQASEFKTEFEINGKEVSLRKVEYNKDNPLPLSYGRGNGFKSGLGRTNSSDTQPVEILFVQGGSRNIDRSKYGSSDLLLPAGQEISYDGEHFEDEEGYIASNARRYAVDDAGLSIRRADKQLTSLAEDSLDCSDTYPKRVGTISSVVVVNAAKNFYDFIDNSIPAALDYEECLIAGETMTVIFQSGMLAGREFEVKYCHQATSSKAGRRFEIVPQEIDGETMPNSTFAPAVGDKYAVFKVMLPQAYIRDDETKSGASWDMFRTGVKYLYDNEEQKFSFTGELDGIWAKSDWVNIGGRIVLGGFVLFSDERFQQDGVLVRITGIKDYINNPHSPVIEISNNTVSSGFASQLKTLESEGVLIEEYHRDALQFTKRRFRDAQETIGMLEESLLANFTNGVSPITVQTMAMLVGDESLQFQFVNNTTNPVPVVRNIYFDSGTMRLIAPSGIIQHFTFDIDAIALNRTPADYHFWNVAAYTSAVLDDPSKKYYLYIKANSSALKGTAGSAVFLLSETAIGLRSVSGYYHFLVGILNSESEGERSFVTLYGFTEILPGRITTDRIVSADGNTYFDLANGVIGGKILFRNNSTGEYFTLIDGGYIRTELIKAVSSVMAGDENGRRIEINPDNKSIYIYDENDTLVSVFEGNNYQDITALFGNSSGNATIIAGEEGHAWNETTEDHGTDTQSGSTVLSNVFNTDTPTLIEVSGSLSCEAACGVNLKDSGYALARLELYVETFSDSACTNRVEKLRVGYCVCSCNGNETTDETAEENTTLRSQPCKVVAGYHRLVMEWYMERNNYSTDSAQVSWSGITASWKSEFYISRFFSNGFCVGTRRDNYVLVQNDPTYGMVLIAENGNYGLRVRNDGVQIRRSSGSWVSL